MEGEGIGIVDEGVDGMGEVALGREDDSEMTTVLDISSFVEDAGDDKAGNLAGETLPSSSMPRAASCFIALGLIATSAAA